MNANFEKSVDAISTATAEYADTASSWVHSPLVMMVIVGLLGGYLSWVNSVHEKSNPRDPVCKKKLWKHLITGVMATLMVPLFLQMIGSSLLDKISPNNSQFYVFLGFCSAAAYVAQRFAGTVSERLLKDVADKAIHAEKEVDKIRVNQFRLQGNIHFLEKEYDKALTYFVEYTQFIPDDINTLSRMAYSFKRIGKIKEALDITQKAISLSKNNDWILYYNRACYRTLLMGDSQIIDDIISDLKKATKFSREDVHSSLENDLSEDFVTLVNTSLFKDFLRTEFPDLLASLEPSVC